MARLIDKGRAFNSQTLGEYWYGRNSGNDLQLLRFLNIPVDEFTEQLQKLPTDQEVLEWVMKQATINEEQIAEFNKKFQMVNFEQMLSNYGPKERRRELFARGVVKLFGLDPEVVNIKTFFDLMVLSDQKIFQFP